MTHGSSENEKVTQAAAVDLRAHNGAWWDIRTAIERYGD